MQATISTLACLKLAIVWYRSLLMQWIYSGDVDADVPLTGTRYWLEKFREEFSLPVIEPWREWWVLGKHTYEDAVGGMIWKLRNITLVTFKLAGHMVPKDQPAAAYDMISAFL